MDRPEEDKSTDAVACSVVDLAEPPLKASKAKPSKHSKEVPSLPTLEFAETDYTEQGGCEQETPGLDGKGREQNPFLKIDSTGGLGRSVICESATKSLETPIPLLTYHSELKPPYADVRRVPQATDSDESPKVKPEIAIGTATKGLDAVPPLGAPTQAAKPPYADVLRVPQATNSDDATRVKPEIAVETTKGLDAVPPLEAPAQAAKPPYADVLRVSQVTNSDDAPKVKPEIAIGTANKSLDAVPPLVAPAQAAKPPYADVLRVSQVTNSDDAPRVKPEIAVETTRGLASVPPPGTPAQTSKPPYADVLRVPQATHSDDSAKVKPETAIETAKGLDSVQPLGTAPTARPPYADVRQVPSKDPAYQDTERSARFQSQTKSLDALPPVVTEAPTKPPYVDQRPASTLRATAPVKLEPGVVSKGTTIDLPPAFPGIEDKPAYADVRRVERRPAETAYPVNSTTEHPVTPAYRERTVQGASVLTDKPQTLPTAQVRVENDLTRAIQLNESAHSMRSLQHGEPSSVAKSPVAPVPDHADHRQLTDSELGRTTHGSPQVIPGVPGWILPLPATRPPQLQLPNLSLEVARSGSIDRPNPLVQPVVRAPRDSNESRDRSPVLRWEPESRNNLPVRPEEQPGTSGPRNNPLPPSAVRPEVQPGTSGPRNNPSTPSVRPEVQPDTSRSRNNPLPPSAVRPEVQPGTNGPRNSQQLPPSAVRPEVQPDTNRSRNNPVPPSAVRPEVRPDTNRSHNPLPPSAVRPEVQPGASGPRNNPLTPSAVRPEVQSDTSRSRNNPSLPSAVRPEVQPGTNGPRNSQQLPPSAVRPEVQSGTGGPRNNPLPPSIVRPEVQPETSHSRNNPLPPSAVRPEVQPGTSGPRDNPLPPSVRPEVHPGISRPQSNPALPSAVRSEVQPDPARSGSNPLLPSAVRPEVQPGISRPQSNPSLPSAVRPEVQPDPAPSDSNPLLPSAVRPEVQPGISRPQSNPSFPSTVRPEVQPDPARSGSNSLLPFAVRPEVQPGSGRLQSNPSLPSTVRPEVQPEPGRSGSNSLPPAAVRPEVQLGSGLLHNNPLLPSSVRPQEQQGTIPRNNQLTPLIVPGRDQAIRQQSTLPGPPRLEQRTGNNQPGYNTSSIPSLSVRREGQPAATEQNKQQIAFGLSSLENREKIWQTAGIKSMPSAVSPEFRTEANRQSIGSPFARGSKATGSIRQRMGSAVSMQSSETPIMAPSKSGSMTKSQEASKLCSPINDTTPGAIEANTDSLNSDHLGESIVLTGLLAAAAVRRREAVGPKDDSDAKSTRERTLSRRNYMVMPGDTLESIAETLYHDSRIAWLIAELNSHSIKETVLDDTLIVELFARQLIELPGAEDLQEFRNVARNRGTARKIVTIVIERSIDRELLKSYLGQVMGDTAEPAAPPSRQTASSTVPTQTVVQFGKQLQRNQLTHQPNSAGASSIATPVIP